LNSNNINNNEHELNDNNYNSNIINENENTNPQNNKKIKKGTVFLPQPDPTASNIHTHVDIVISRPLSNEKTIYMDVQIKNPMCPSFKSLENSENVKEKLYKQAVESVNAEFVTPTFDVFGNPSKKTEEFIKRLFESRIRNLSGEERLVQIRLGRPMNYWLTKISLVINHFKALQINRQVDKITTDSMLSDKINTIQSSMDRIDDQIYMRRHKT